MSDPVTKLVQMRHVKTTKGTHVYEASDDEHGQAVCASVYLRRSELPEPPPQKIELRVTYQR
jgi:hypothetical protein